MTDYFKIQAIKNVIKLKPENKLRQNHRINPRNSHTNSLYILVKTHFIFTPTHFKPSQKVTVHYHTKQFNSTSPKIPYQTNHSCKYPVLLNITTLTKLTLPKFTPTIQISKQPIIKKITIGHGTKETEAKNQIS